MEYNVNEGQTVLRYMGTIITHCFPSRQVVLKIRLKFFNIDERQRRRCPQLIVVLVAVVVEDFFCPGQHCNDFEVCKIFDGMRIFGLL
jgi:hypothetical protein